MLASLLVVLTAILAVTAFLLDMMSLIEAERMSPTPERPPDRIHSPRSS
jgi:hypothetical protein